MRVKLVVGLVMIASASLFAQPKIEIVGGTTFAFGKIFRGKMMERVVVVKNTGSETLELGQINVSCGCTGTVATNKSIAPGKTGTVSVLFEVPSGFHCRRQRVRLAPIFRIRYIRR